MQIKDIHSYEKLKVSFEYCMTLSKQDRVYVETDMRAHANPLRMHSIEKATDAILKELGLVLFDKIC